MTSLLITAFGPYDHWKTNASELCMQEIDKLALPDVLITTRSYPVNFEKAHRLLVEDLKKNYDFVIHLGQSPKSDHIRLDLFAVNAGSDPAKAPGKFWELSENGPAAYQVHLPLAEWAHKLKENGIPAAVSFHAGTRLCNATLYWSHQLIEKNRYHTKPILIHIPMDTSQAENQPKHYPSLPIAESARALKIILESLAKDKNIASI